MARVKIAGTSGASENTIVFSPAGGHSHNGRNSSLIDSTAYSVYDFSPTFVGTEVNPDRAVRQENNRIAFEDLIKRVVNNSVLAPAGIRLEPGSLNGSLIIANTITANQLAANTITASEISAGTITANELSSNIVLINNRITSQNWNGTIEANGTILSNNIGSAGWAITNTHAVFDSTLIRGSIAANSLVTPNLTISNTGAITSTSFNVTAGGNVTATNANITGSITSNSGTIGGWTIQSNRFSGGSTYLYSNGSMAIGSTTIAANGQITNGGYTLSAAGALTATGANISGIITATSGTFTGTVNAAGGTFSGSITANGTISGGTISGGTISGGTITGAIISGGRFDAGGATTLGHLNNISAGHYGLDLGGDFTNIFLRRTSDNGVFFRVSNGIQWIKFENGSVQITTPGFSVNGSSASFAGSISASTISGGTISGTTISGSTLTTNDGTNGIEITSDGYLRGTGGSGVRIKNSDGSTGGTQFFKDLIFSNTTRGDKLEVVSRFTAADIGVTISPTDGNTPLILRRNYVGGGNFISFHIGSAAAMTALEFKTNTKVDFSWSSDFRMKKEITDLTNGLDIIRGIRPVSYRMKSDPLGDYEDGFIAQELFNVYPSAVSEGTDDLDENGNLTKPWKIFYNSFTPIFASAIKELLGKVEALEARIQTLEGV